MSLKLRVHDFPLWAKGCTGFTELDCKPRLNWLKGITSKAEGRTCT